MKNVLSKSLLALTAACALPAAADTITLWDFNEETLSPSTGAGTAGYVGGTVFDSYAGGSSSDPSSTNLGWNTRSYPSQGTANKTAGVEFRASTVGFVEISVSYDIRRSNTASKYERFQYSLNGIDFVDFDGFAGSGTSFVTRTVDLSSIPGVEDNPDFAFRIVSEFTSTATGSGADSYAATGTSSTYGTAGTWRFDMVGVSGTSVSPVPEPATSVLGLAGLMALALRRSRR